MNINKYNRDDEITIILESGEVFENAQVVGKEHDPADSNMDSAYTSLTLEGDWWEDVNERVDSEVLTLIQRKGYRNTQWDDPELFGTIWVGEIEEASEPEYKKLGTVESIE